MALMAWAGATPFAEKRVSDLLIHYPAGGKRNAREAARLKRMGVRAGIPDYFLHVVKIAESGTIYGGLWIELKAGDKPRFSDSQVEQLEHLRFCGYRTEKAHGWVEAARHICTYLGIKAPACMDLTRTILFRIAESPVSYAHLERWVRLQWPRVLPAAVDNSLSHLARLHFVECVNKRWRISHAP